jgi:hypothetical protein
MKLTLGMRAEFIVDELERLRSQIPTLNDRQKYIAFVEEQLDKAVSEAVEEVTLKVESRAQRMQKIEERITRIEGDLRYIMTFQKEPG